MNEETRAWELANALGRINRPSLGGARNAETESWLPVAEALLASDWLAAHDAAVRDQATKEAAAKASALADGWEGEADEIEGVNFPLADALTGCAAALRAALGSVSAPGNEGSTLIREERRRQIEEEGYTPEHDAAHGGFVLSQAATAYEIEGFMRHGVPTRWTWHPVAWKPRDPIRNLIRAGALFLAAHEQGYPSALEAANRCAASIDAAAAALRAAQPADQPVEEPWVWHPDGPEAHAMLEQIRDEETRNP